MIIEPIDALRELLPVAEDVLRDDGVSEPFEAQPKRLYVWPRRFARQQLNLEAEAAGFFSDSTLAVRILYTLPARGEPRVQRTDRTISVALDAATAAIIEAIEANRSHELWWHAIVETVVPDAVRNVNVRGYGLDVLLRLNAPFGEAMS